MGEPQEGYTRSHVSDEIASVVWALAEPDLSKSKAAGVRGHKDAPFDHRASGLGLLTATSNAW